MPNWNHIVRQRLAILRLPPEREIEIVEEIALHLEAVYEDALAEGLSPTEAEARAVRHRWISEAELDANPQLVRSMSVQPPRGLGRVRVLEIEGVDLQPCGGTHVANTADIGAVVVTKIEKKSAMTRRVVLGFAEPAAG